jgi:1-acyl-sn-glycerol-3-phosphate acyltransferase
VKNNQKPRGRLYVWLVTRSFIFMRGILFFFGFVHYSNTRLRINDAIADYAPIQDCSVAPLVVSNHCSWADMFFYLKKNVSFLSKSSVASAPLLGMHATARQSIYLNREDQNDRDKVVELIKARTKRVREHGDLSPLLIFPEGTVTNGRVLMSFKKGPFFSGDPIKIYVLKYNADNQMVSSIINISALYSFLITILQVRNRIELFEYEDNFDPEYVYKKYNISKDDPDAWKTVANEVKGLMAFASGFRTSEDTYRDTLDFEKESLEKDDNIIELI